MSIDRALLLESVTALQTAAFPGLMKREETRAKFGAYRKTAQEQNQDAPCGKRSLSLSYCSANQWMKCKSFVIRSQKGLTQNPVTLMGVLSLIQWIHSTSIQPFESEVFLLALERLASGERTRLLWYDSFHICLSLAQRAGHWS